MSVENEQDDVLVSVGSRFLAEFTNLAAVVEESQQTLGLSPNIDALVFSIRFNVLEVQQSLHTLPQAFFLDAEHFVILTSLMHSIKIPKEIN